METSTTGNMPNGEATIDYFYKDSTTDMPSLPPENIANQQSATMQTLNLVLLIIFNGYIAIVVFALGIFGNLMSIVIFIKRRKADRISAQYLGVLAVSDLCLLAFIAVPGWVRGIFIVLQDYIYWDRQMPNDLICKIYVYFWNSLSILSSWILVMFSFERTLVIWMPLKMGPIFASSKPRKIGLAIVFLLSFIFPLGHIRWIALRNTSGWYRCMGKIDLPMWEIHVGNFIAFAIPMAIPLILLTILNILLVIGVRRNRIGRQKSSKSAASDNRMIMNLLSVSLFYFIFITPTVVLTNLYYYYDSTGFAGFTLEGAQIFDLLFTSSRTIASFNNAVNPWIYTFSLDFYRKTLLEIICPCCNRRKLMNSNSSTMKSCQSQSSIISNGYVVESFGAADSQKVGVNTVSEMTRM